MTGAGLYGCPICGQGLTPSELESHYSTELDFLAKISLSVLRSPETREMVRHRFAVNNLSPGSHGGLAEQAPRNRWDVSQVILFYFLNFSLVPSLSLPSRVVVEKIKSPMYCCYLWRTISPRTIFSNCLMKTFN